MHHCCVGVTVAGATAIGGVTVVAGVTAVAGIIAVTGVAYMYVAGISAVAAGDQFVAGVIDIGEDPSQENISADFRRKCDK